MKTREKITWGVFLTSLFRDIPVEARTLAERFKFCILQMIALDFEAHGVIKFLKILDFVLGIALLNLHGRTEDLQYLVYYPLFIHRNKHFVHQNFLIVFE